MKSGDTFVYWVSSKPALLTLYISRLSFSLHSTTPSCPFDVLYFLFLLTDDACLDQHSFRETRGAKDVFIEKLRRHDSSNLTVTMWNAERERERDEYERWIFTKRVQPRSSRKIRFRQVRKSYVTNNVDINFILKVTLQYFIRCDIATYCIATLNQIIIN